MALDLYVQSWLVEVSKVWCLSRTLHRHVKRNEIKGNKVVMKHEKLTPYFHPRASFFLIGGKMVQTQKKVKSVINRKSWVYCYSTGKHMD